MATRTQIIPLAEQFEPAMRDSLIRAFNKLRTQYTITQIEQMFASGGVETVLAYYENMEDIIASDFLNVFDNAANLGGSLAVEFIPASGVINPNFRYSQIDPATASYLNTYEFDLINTISTNTRDAVRSAVIDGYRDGLNPREQARNFRNTLGLTRKQEEWVANYRRQLTELDKRALERTLRDGRFDSTVRTAIDNNQPLSKTQIDKMVQRYRERLILSRSETIARTEALRAVSMGQEQGVQQLIRNRAIDTDNIRQFWIFTPDERTRAAHRMIPGMNPEEGIKLGELFRTPLGPLRFPRDPNGTAANTINCRCRRVFRMLDERGRL